MAMAAGHACTRGPLRAGNGSQACELCYLSLRGLRLAIRICMYLWNPVLHCGVGGRVDERGTWVCRDGARLNMALVFALKR